MPVYRGFKAHSLSYYLTSLHIEEFMPKYIYISNQGYFSKR